MPSSIEHRERQPAGNGAVADPAVRLRVGLEQLARLVGVKPPPAGAGQGAVQEAYAAIVAAAVEHVRNQEEAAARLQMRMSTDPLTGVNNRGGWEEALARAEIETKAARGAAQFAVALFDLDGLKSVNDSSGHAAGDELLRSFARILSGSARLTDYVARIGGDEFAALLRDCNRWGAATWCARVLEAVAIQNAARPERPILVSHGYAAATGGGRVAEAVAAADRALYRTKIAA